MRDLRKDGSGGRLTDSRNGRQQIAPALEVRMVVEVLANLPLNLRDLFVERGDDLPNRGRNRRLRPTIVRTRIASLGLS
jgi:hypothetical protein